MWITLELSCVGAEFSIALRDNVPFAWDIILYEHPPGLPHS